MPLPRKIKRYSMANACRKLISELGGGMSLENLEDIYYYSKEACMSKWKDKRDVEEVKKVSVQRQ